jgi:hypothetical protein
VLAGLGRSQLLAGDGVPQREGAEVVAVQAGLALCERAALEEDVAPDDLAGGEIAVVDALAQLVLVDGVAEVAQVVGRDLGVTCHSGGRRRKRRRQLARRRGEADLDGVVLRVSTVDQSPQPERWHSSMITKLK